MFVFDDKGVYCYVSDGILHPIPDIKHLLHASLGCNTIMYIPEGGNLIIMCVDPIWFYTYRGNYKNARKLVSFDKTIVMIFDDHIQVFNYEKNIKTLPISGVLDVVDDYFQRLIYTTCQGMYRHENGHIDQVATPPGTIYTAGHTFGDLIYLIKNENSYSIQTKYSGLVDSSTNYIGDYIIISFVDLAIVICPDNIFSTIILPEGHISSIESNQKSIIITFCDERRMIYSVDKTRYSGGSILYSGKLPMKKLIKRACS